MSELMFLLGFFSGPFVIGLLLIAIIEMGETK